MNIWPARAGPAARWWILKAENYWELQNPIFAGHAAGDLKTHLHQYGPLGGEIPEKPLFFEQRVAASIQFRGARTIIVCEVRRHEQGFQKKMPGRLNHVSHSGRRNSGQGKKKGGAATHEIRELAMVWAVSAARRSVWPAERRQKVCVIWHATAHRGVKIGPARDRKNGLLGPPQDFRQKMRYACTRPIV